MGGNKNMQSITRGFRNSLMGIVIAGGLLFGGMENADAQMVDSYRIFRDTTKKGAKNKREWNAILNNQQLIENGAARFEAEDAEKRQKAMQAEIEKQTRILEDIKRQQEDARQRYAESSRTVSNPVYVEKAKELNYQAYLDINSPSHRYNPKTNREEFNRNDKIIIKFYSSADAGDISNLRYEIFRVYSIINRELKIFDRTVSVNAATADYDFAPLLNERKSGDYDIRICFEDNTSSRFRLTIK